MPFANRERPRLVERLRGKSGQDLFNEVKSALNSDSRRMLFDTPSWRNSAFPRGFPFDDDESPSGRRSFLGRHRDRPFGDRAADFAETLHEPPFDEDYHNKRHVPEPAPPPAAASASLNQHGLRNTVPFAQAPNPERPSRAMSAPPCDRPQRFTSSVEIPVMGDPPQQQQPPPASAASGNIVRVIPIQVEGRDEPLINSNIDTSTNFTAETPTFDGRLPRDFGPFRKHSARFQQSPHQPSYEQPAPKPPQPPKPPQQSRPQEQAKAQQQTRPQSAPQPQQHSQKSFDEPDRPAPPPDPTALALSRIADVHREVEALSSQVEAATPSSRKDKQYVYLDEMLTRQLLQLDNVDPAGQDNIRQARRDAIRAIQKCISQLESKIPGEAMEVDAEATEVEQTVNNAGGEPMTITAEAPASELVSAEAETVPPTAESTPPTIDPAPPTADPPA